MADLTQLYQSGVSAWLDNLSRQLISSGELKTWISSRGLRGLTSNPSIFEKAFASDPYYRERIEQLKKNAISAEDICWQLMREDVKAACQEFLGLYEESQGQDGFVSLELNPGYSKDIHASVNQAQEIWEKVAEPNLMIKVPATPEGVVITEELLTRGMNVNVTLLFSVDRYNDVIRAYQSAIARRIKEGLSTKNIASVASFFISRVDSALDPLLAEQAPELKGQCALANARLAYHAFKQAFTSEHWKQISSNNTVNKQRPLWASTSTKDPSYPETLYVDNLIGPNCVNTIPDATLQVFLERGQIQGGLSNADIQSASDTWKELNRLSIDLPAIFAQLESEGLRKFQESYNNLVQAIDA